MTPEFSRSVRLDAIGDAREISLVAEPREREALAARFGLVAIDRLAATATLIRDAAEVRVSGRLEAAVVQSCVATGEPVTATVEETLALRFVPFSAFADREEIELPGEDCDILGFAGGAIDLGEAVAETLALALDPFPRIAGAEAVLKAAGVLDEESARMAASPFAKLQKKR